eukprot:11822432-Heterocapsa_arctica.AAC.1
MDDHLLQAVASQMASNLQGQFGGQIMGGQGRRGESYRGNGQQFGTPQNGKLHADWDCDHDECGYMANWGKRL